MILIIKPNIVNWVLLFLTKNTVFYEKTHKKEVLQEHMKKRTLKMPIETPIKTTIKILEILDLILH